MLFLNIFPKLEKCSFKKYYFGKSFNVVWYVILGSKQKKKNKG